MKTIARLFGVLAAAAAACGALTGEAASLNKNGDRDFSQYFAGPGQICFSSPLARQTVARQLKEFIEADRKEFPDSPPPLYNLSINDTHDRCECGDIVAAEHYIHAEGFIRQRSDLFDILCELIGIAVCGGKDSETAGIGDRSSKDGIRDMCHAALHQRIFRSQQRTECCCRRHISPQSCCQRKRSAL